MDVDYICMMDGRREVAFRYDMLFDARLKSAHWFAQGGHRPREGIARLLVTTTWSDAIPLLTCLQFLLSLLKWLQAGIYVY